MGNWEERRRGSPSQDVIKEKTIFLIKKMTGARKPLNFMNQK